MQFIKVKKHAFLKNIKKPSLKTLFTLFPLMPTTYFQTKQNQNMHSENVKTETTKKKAT